MKEGLSIIIVNYYSEAYVISLVETILLSLKLKEFEIIIMSNSPSSFLWSVSYLIDNNITIYDNHQNDGFGISTNKGVEYAVYNKFCMINPDILMNKDTIDVLYNYFETLDEDVGAISCVVNNPDGTRQTSCFMNNRLEKTSFFINYFKFILPKRLRNIFFKKDIIKLDFTRAFEVGGFYGAFVMIRKNMFLELKGFDPDFFMYAEDVEFFRSRFSKKYKCILYPFVKVTHLVGKTDKYALMKYQSQVSYLLYLRKVGTYYLFVYVLLLSIKYSVLLGYSLIKHREDKEEALGFFKSLKYLKKIFQYPKGYGKLGTPLKINEIPD